MIKTFTSILTKFLLLSAFLWTSNNLFAQNEYSLPGSVSQLTISEDGKLMCNMHTHDDVSLEHHNSVSDITLSSNKASFKISSDQNKKKGSGTGATIYVDYYNFDPTFSYDQFLEAAIAFQSAVDTWATLIDSDVPIYVAAAFQPLGTGILGSAGSTYIISNTPGLERDSWYGNALADKLAGEDLIPGAYDIVARFSTVFPNWYFGTDGLTPATDYDFRSVVLHEIGHGLGFFGSMTVSNTTGIGSYGFGIPDPVLPAIYDRLMYSPENKSILKDSRYPNYSTELGDMLMSGSLNAKGPRIKKATNGKGAEIFTILDSEVFGDIPGYTDMWLSGSSYSHLDYLTYGGTANGLMVPFLSRGVSFPDPGEVTLAIFDDLGWNGQVNRVYNDNARVAASELDLEVTTTAFGVYPNPMNNSFSLSLGEKESALVNASLVDALGRQMPLDISNQQGAEVQFDLSQKQLKAGVYILRLHFENQEISNIRLLKN
ncbi:MAG: hypothetical protein CMO01_16845 [Thalassobius sp.]|nr:hypothetical protein [Thalassovita sp.]